MYSEKRKLGNIGENIACEFLRRRGFKVIERNYLRKWGEIDIVATKDGTYHFVEVKSVSGEIKTGEGEAVSHGTSDRHRPEDNLHPQKLRRLYRTIETYLLSKKVDADWQIDLITVRLDEHRRLGRAEMLENIVG